MMKVGTLGAGYFAQLHHDAWGRVQGAELIGICDRDAARADAAAGKTGARAYHTLDDMLEAGLDIFDIAIPPEGHAVAIRAGLSAGPKAIICQKPFCTSLDEARAVTAEAEEAGIPLIVHENFRWQPWWRAIRDAVHEGAIGQPYTATFRLRPGDGQGPDAYLSRQPYFQTMPRLVIHETGVHYIDVFRFILGDPVALWADLRRLNPAIKGEDAGHLLMEHQGDARSLLDANRLSDHPTDDVRRTLGEGLIEGADGTLTLTGDGVVTLRSFGEAKARVILPARDLPGFGGDCVGALQRHVVAHFADGSPLENVAAEYLRVIEIEEAAYRSAAEGRRLEV